MTARPPLQPQRPRGGGGLAKGLLAVLAVGAGLLLLRGVRYFAKNGRGAAQHRKLGDLTPEPARFTFVCPPGSRYWLLLGLPRRKIGLPTQPLAPPRLHGTLALRHQGQLVLELPLEKAKLSWTNWLGNEDLHACSLTWPQPGGKEAFNAALRPEEEYEVSISAARPPEGTSLWLQWRTDPRR